MPGLVESPFKAWETYCVIVGSSAAALAGLQFVVLTLIGESRAVRGGAETIAAFGSPTVVHFCAALLISAIMTAPWPAPWPGGVAIATTGLLGLAYSSVVFKRARRQQGYVPVTEDWVWHVILPTLAYGTLFFAGVVIERGPAGALYFVGGAMLLLVFIGIHNAWDTVTYVIAQGLRAAEKEREDAMAARAPTVPTSPVTSISPSRPPSP